MNIDDINKLKDGEVKKLSFIQAQEVIKILSTTNTYDLTNQQALEHLEAYRNIIAIIIARINRGDFNELNAPKKKLEKEQFLWNLLNLQSSYTYMLSVNNTLNKTVYKTTRVYNNVIQQEKNINENFKKAIARLEDSEHTILSHVLSIMGVFSAIITIILSIIITSSSWLNNADGASAIIAFVVPNIVALFVVFVLLSLVFFYLHKDTNERGKKCAKQKRSCAFTFAIIGTLVSAGLCCWLCISSSPKTATHIRYIIPPIQYELVEEDTSDHKCSHNNNCNCKSAVEIKFFYEFTFEDKLYRFEYDESYIHDGNLYFCEKHHALE